MDVPFFSVVIPCYNVGNIIGPTLKSLENQTFKDFEVVFVNDGSTDNTLEILNNYKMVQRKLVLSQKNEGLGSARNAGIKKSTGKYIALLDADDIWEDDKLEKVFEYIERFNCDLVCHDEFIKESNGRIIGRNKYGPYTSFMDLLLKGNCLSPSSTIIRKDIFFKVGYFSEDRKLIGVEDYDLWLRMAKQGVKIDYLHEFLGSYIIHNANMTGSFNFYDRVEYLLMLYSYEINLNDFWTLMHFKGRFVKFYLGKMKRAIELNRYSQAIIVLRELFFVILKLKQHIRSKIVIK